MTQKMAHPQNRDGAIALASTFGLSIPKPYRGGYVQGAHSQRGKCAGCTRGRPRGAALCTVRARDLIPASPKARSSLTSYLRLKYHSASARAINASTSDFMAVVLGTTTGPGANTPPLAQSRAPHRRVRPQWGVRPVHAGPLSQAYDPRRAWDRR